jgi:hypothetical protein
MDMKERGSGLILRYYTRICIEGLKKTTKNSVRIAGLQTEIRTQDLLNKKYDC